MDVGEPVEERIPEAVVYKVVDAPAVAHVQGEGDVLRLAVEGRRVRDAQLFHMLQAHDAQGRRHHEMHHVRPGRRLFKHMADTQISSPGRAPDRVRPMLCGNSPIAVIEIVTGA